MQLLRGALRSADVCVIGLGYIGLPTASLLAANGYRVHGIDTSSRVIESILRMETHFYEPELDSLLQTAVRSGLLSASEQPVTADVYIIAVPTPIDSQKQPDLSHVMDAADAIGPYLRPESLIILESTSPVGTTQALAARLRDMRTDLEQDGSSRLHVAYCPERVLPGRILTELVRNDRLVGGIDPTSTERATAFYRSFVSGEVIATDARTAELTKLAENAYRDVNIAYANELSMVCAELDLDVREVIRLANRHPRVEILEPGPGVGGHCIAVDPWFIASSAPGSARLIRMAREVNLAKERWVIERVVERARRFHQPMVACLGLTYKPDVGDLRESPALAISRALTRQLSAMVVAVDPFVSSTPGLHLVSLEQALAKSDILVALVGHREFRDISRDQLAEKVVIDTCGVFR